MKYILFIPGARAENAPVSWLQSLLKRLPLQYFEYQPRKQISHWQDNLGNEFEVEVFEWNRYW